MSTVKFDPADWVDSPLDTTLAVNNEPGVTLIAMTPEEELQFVAFERERLSRLAANAADWTDEPPSVANATDDWTDEPPEATEASPAPAPVARPRIAHAEMVANTRAGLVVTGPQPGCGVGVL